MDLEEEPSQSQKHQRSETADDRPNKHPRHNSNQGKGKGNLEGRCPHGSGNKSQQVQQPRISAFMPSCLKPVQAVPEARKSESSAPTVLYDSRANLGGS